MTFDLIDFIYIGGAMFWAPIILSAAVAGKIAYDHFDCKGDIHDL
jgi:hypothetical protein